MLVGRIEHFENPDSQIKTQQPLKQAYNQRETSQNRHNSARLGKLQGPVDCAARFMPERKSNNPLLVD